MAGLVAASALLCGFVLAPWSSPRADEGGVGMWLPGQYSSFAAVPQQPGWSMPINVYYYDGSASGSKTLSRGEALNFGLGTHAAITFFTPTWAPNEKWFGGQPAFSLTFGAGWNATSVDLAISTDLGTQTANRSDSKTGGVDLYPQAQISWNKGVNNWMVYVMGDVPVGAYDPTRLSNLGIGHSAIDGGGAYTYLNSKTGLEVSATLGVTYNYMNTSTNYQNGWDSHLDWELSQFVSEHAQLGVVGYIYYQLTADGGSGASLGAFESRAAAVGPEIACPFAVGGQQWYFNFRGYWEFWAEKRTEGYPVFATLSIPLGRKKK